MDIKDLVLQTANGTETSDGNELLPTQKSGSGNIKDIVLGIQLPGISTSNLTSDYNYRDKNLEQYDFPIYPGQDPNETAALNQTAGDLTKAAAGNFLGSFVNSIGATAGTLLAGIPTIIGRGASGDDLATSVSGIYDNPINKVFNDFQKTMQEWAPVYKTKELQDAPWYEYMMSPEFLASDAASGAGYFYGAYVAGLGMVKGMAAASKFMPGTIRSSKDLFSTMNGIQGAAETGANLATPISGMKNGIMAAKVIKNPNIVSQFAVAMTMAAGEASAEANGVKETIMQQLKQARAEGKNNLSDEQIESEASRGANVDFASNLVIVGATDMLMFGRSLTGSFDASMKSLSKQNAKKMGELIVEKKIEKTAIKTGEKAVAESLLPELELAAEKKGLNRLKRAGLGFLEEGSQEWGQYITQEANTDYYSLRNDPEAKKEITNLLGSYWDTLGDKSFSKEAIISTLLGGLMGGPAQVAMGRGERKADENNAAAALKTIKEFTPEKIAKYANNIESLTRIQALNNKAGQALDINDEMLFRTFKHSELMAYVRLAEEQGVGEMLVERIKKLKDASADKMKTFFNMNDKIDLTEEEKNKRLDNIISRVNEGRQAHQDLEIRWGVLPKAVKDTLYDAMTSIENLDNRQKSIAEKIQSTIGLKFPGLAIPFDFNEYMTLAAQTESEGGETIDDKKETVSTWKQTAKDWVESIKNSNPEAYQEIRKDLNDLFRISDLREVYVKNFNDALKNPEAFNYVLEKTKKIENIINAGGHEDDLDFYEQHTSDDSKEDGRYIPIGERGKFPGYTSQEGVFPADYNPKIGPWDGKHMPDGYVPPFKVNDPTKEFKASEHGYNVFGFTSAKFKAKVKLSPESNSTEPLEEVEVEILDMKDTKGVLMFINTKDPNKVYLKKQLEDITLVESAEKVRDKIYNDAKNTILKKDLDVLDKTELLVEDAIIAEIKTTIDRIQAGIDKLTKKADKKDIGNIALQELDKKELERKKANVKKELKASIASVRQLAGDDVLVTTGLGKADTFMAEVSGVEASKFVGFEDKAKLVKALKNHYSKQIKKLNDEWKSRPLIGAAVDKDVVKINGITGFQGIGDLMDILKERERLLKQHIIRRNRLVAKKNAIEDEIKRQGSARELQEADSEMKSLFSEMFIADNRTEAEITLEKEEEAAAIKKVNEKYERGITVNGKDINDYHFDKNSHTGEDQVMVLHRTSPTSYSGSGTSLELNVPDFVKKVKEIENNQGKVAALAYIIDELVKLETSFRDFDLKAIEKKYSEKRAKHLRDTFKIIGQEKNKRFNLMTRRFIYAAEIKNIEDKIKVVEAMGPQIQKTIDSLKKSIKGGFAYMYNLYRKTYLKTMEEDSEEYSEYRELHDNWVGLEEKAFNKNEEAEALDPFYFEKERDELFNEADKIKKEANKVKQQLIDKYGEEPKGLLKDMKKALETKNLSKYVSPASTILTDSGFILDNQISLLFPSSPLSVKQKIEALEALGKIPADIAQRLSQLKLEESNLEDVKKELKSLRDNLRELKKKNDISQKIYDDIVTEIRIATGKLRIKTVPKPETPSQDKKKSDLEGTKEAEIIIEENIEKIILGSKKKSIWDIFSTTSSSEGVNSPAKAQKRWIKTISKISLTNKDKDVYKLLMVTADSHPEFFDSAHTKDGELPWADNNKTGKDKEKTVMAILVKEGKDGKNIFINQNLEEVKDPKNATDADGLVFTVLHNPSFLHSGAGFTDKFHDAKANQALADELMHLYESFLSEVVKDNLEIADKIKKGEKLKLNESGVLVRIMRKSNGIFEKYDGKRIKNDPSTGLPKVGDIDNTISVFNLLKSSNAVENAKIKVATDSTGGDYVEVGSSKNRIKLRRGLPYLELYNGDIIPLASRNLTEDEIKTVYNLLLLAAKMPKGEERFNPDGSLWKKGDKVEEDKQKAEKKKEKKSKILTGAATVYSKDKDATGYYRLDKDGKIYLLKKGEKQKQVHLKGKAYGSLKGRIIAALNRDNKPKEAKIEKTKATGKGESIFSYLKSIMYYGPHLTKDGKEIISNPNLDTIIFDYNYTKNEDGTENKVWNGKEMFLRKEGVHYLTFGNPDITNKKGTGENEMIHIEFENIASVETLLKKFLANKTHQVKGVKASNTTEKFVHITNVSDSGKITTEVYNNYKSYLIGNIHPGTKDNKGAERLIKDIPFTSGLIGDDIYNNMYVVFDQKEYVGELPNTPEEENKEEPEEKPKNNKELTDEEKSERARVRAIKMAEMMDDQGAMDDTSMTDEEAADFKKYGLTGKPKTDKEKAEDQSLYPEADKNKPINKKGNFKGSAMDSHPNIVTKLDEDYEKTDLDQAEKNLKEILPQVTMRRIYSKLVKGRFFGVTTGAVMTLSDLAPKGIEYHEAFHDITLGILEYPERRLLYNAATKVWGIPTNEQLKYLVSIYPDDSPQRLAERFYDEKLAEAFRNFMVSGDLLDITVNEKAENNIKSIFQQIIDFINLLLKKLGFKGMINSPVKNDPKVNKYLHEFFQSIKKGDFKNIPIRDFSESYSDAYFSDEISSKLTQEIMEYVTMSYFQKKLQKDSIEKIGKIREEKEDKDQKNEINQLLNEILIDVTEKLRDIKRISEEQEDKGLYSEEIYLNAAQRREIDNAIDAFTFKEGDIKKFRHNYKFKKAWDAYLRKFGFYFRVTNEDTSLNFDEIVAKQKGLVADISLGGGKQYIESSAKSTAHHLVKLMLSSLRGYETIEDGKRKISIPKKGDYGLDQPGEWGQTFQLIAKNLKGLYTWQEQLDVLNKMAVSNREIRDLVQILESPATSYAFKTIFKRAFFNTTPIHNLAIVEKDKTLNIIDGISDNQRKKIKDRWEINLYHAVDTKEERDIRINSIKKMDLAQLTKVIKDEFLKVNPNDYSKIDELRTAVLDDLLGEDWNIPYVSLFTKEKGNYALIHKHFDKKDPDSFFSKFLKTYATDRKKKSDAWFINYLARPLGIEFTDLESSKLDTSEILKKLTEVYNYISTDANIKTPHDLIFGVAGLKTKFNKDQSTRINFLADQEAEVSVTDITHEYRGPDGSRNYGLHKPSFINKMTDGFNSTANRDAMFAKFPHLNTIATRHTALWRLNGHLYDINGEKRPNVTFQSSFYNGMSEREGDFGNSTTNLSQGERRAMFWAQAMGNPESSSNAVNLGMIWNSDKSLSPGFLISQLYHVSEFEEGYSERFTEQFKDYLRYDIKRNALLSNNNLAIGEDIEVYGQRINTLGIFKEIFNEPGISKKVKDKLDILLTGDFFTGEEGEVYSEVEEFVNMPEVGQILLNHFNKRVAQNKAEMNRFKLIKSRVDPNTRQKVYDIVGDRFSKGLSMDEIDQKLRYFTAMDMTMNFEQILFITGDTNFYGDVMMIFKRISQFAALKDFAADDEDTIQGIIEENKNSLGNNPLIKSDGRRDDGKMPNGIINVLALKESKLISAQLPFITKKITELYAKDPEHPTAKELKIINKIVAPYANINEADGMGFMTLPEYREWYQRNIGLSPEFEAAYKKAMNKDLQVDGKTQMPLTPEEMVFFQPKKLHVGGFQHGNTMYGKNPDIKLASPAVFKFCIFPMIPSVYAEMNSMLEAYADEAIAHGDNSIGMFVVGPKVGAVMQPVINENGEHVLDENGRKKFETAEMYDIRGDEAVLNTEMLEGASLMSIPYNILGEQVKIKDKPEEDGSFGVQVKKMMQSNLFSSGEPNAIQIFDRETNTLSEAKPENAVKLTKTINNSLMDLVINGQNILINKLGLEDLGYTKSGERKIRIKDWSKTAELLKDRLEKAGLSSENIDSIPSGSLTGAEVRLLNPLDANTERNKIENILLSLVNREILDPHVFGGSKIQTSIMGLNTTSRKVVLGKNGKPQVQADDTECEFYREGEYGEILPAQFMIPMTESFYHLVIKFGSLDAVNTHIWHIFKTPGERYKPEHQELIRLLTGISYRVPTGTKNYVDVFEIIKFFPAEAGSIVVAPTEIVTKTGADFDVDTLHFLFSKAKLATPQADFDGPNSKFPETVMKYFIDKYGQERGQEYIRKFAKFIYKKKVGNYAGKPKLTYDKDQKASWIYKEGTPIIETYEGIVGFHNYITQEKDDIPKGFSKKDMYNSSNLEDRGVDLYADFIEAEKEYIKLNISEMKHIFYDEDSFSSIKDSEGNEIQWKSEKAKEFMDDVKIKKNVIGLPVNSHIPIKDIALNSFIKASIQILTSPQGASDLLMPNTTDTILPIAEKIEKIYGIEREIKDPSNILVFSFIHKLADVFLTSKLIVGRTVNNLNNHVLAQVGGLKVNKTYKRKAKEYDTLIEGEKKGTMITRSSDMYFSEFEDDQDYSLGREFDKNKEAPNRIISIISEYLNGYLETVKNTFIYSINAGKQMQNIHMYLLRRGVPVESVINFLNQPIVIDLVEQMEINDNQLLEPYHALMNPDGRKGFQDIVKSLKKKYSEQAKLKNSTYKKSGITVYFTADRLDKTILNANQISKLTKNESDNFYDVQLQVLDNLLEYREQTEIVTAMVLNTAMDTHENRSLDEVYVHNYVAEKMFDDNLINAESLHRTIDNTYLKVYGEANKEIEDILHDFFLTLSSPIVKKKMREMLQPYIDNNDIMNPDKVEIAELIKTEFLTFLIHVYPSIEEGDEYVSISDQAQYYINPTNQKENPNYTKMFRNIRKLISSKSRVFKKLYKSNVLLQALTVMSDPGKSKTEALVLLKKELLGVEQDVIIQDFQALFNAGIVGGIDIADIATAIAVTGILQSGLSYSPYSYLNKIPPRMYTKVINTAFENFQKDSGAGVLHFFDDQFYRNNYKKNILIPRIYLGKKNRIVNNELIVESDRYRKYPWLKIWDSGLKDFSIFKASKYDYETKEFSGYYESPKSGNAGLFKEYKLHAGHSDIDVNNIDKSGKLIDTRILKLKPYVAGNTSDDTPVQEVKKPTKKIKGINIYSRETGLGKQLSNFARMVVRYKGVDYESSEKAYQANKEELDDASVLRLMTDIITAKLSQHPELIEEITDKGGIPFLDASTHDIGKEDRWTGQNGLFMQALKKAYSTVKPAELEKRVLPKSVVVSKQTGKSLQDKMSEKLAEIQKGSSAEKWTKKEQEKTAIATQYIGEGAPGSSTDKYNKLLYGPEGLSNTGKYTSDDTVYVSSNGTRGGRINPVLNGKLQGEYLNVQKAMDAGAKIIMDTVTHLEKTGNYNIGEKALAEYLEKNGYKRAGKSGLWVSKDYKPGKIQPKTESKNIKSTAERLVFSQLNKKERDAVKENRITEDLFNGAPRNVQEIFLICKTKQ